MCACVCVCLGLAIDYYGERVYWADSELSVIGSVRFDGSDAQVAASIQHGERDRQTDRKMVIWKVEDSYRQIKAERETHTWRQTDKQIDIEAGRKTDRQTDRNGQTDRAQQCRSEVPIQTNQQTDIHIDRQIERLYKSEVQ